MRCEEDVTANPRFARLESEDQERVLAFARTIDGMSTDERNLFIQKIKSFAERVSIDLSAWRTHGKSN